MPHPQQEATYVFPEAQWSLIPEHMHGAVYRYVMHGAQPGDFLCAILDNDFMEAAGRADDDNLRALAGWAKFLYNFMPGGSFRSAERRLEWQAKGGVLGKPEAS